MRFQSRQYRSPVARSDDEVADQGSPTRPAAGIGLATMFADTVLDVWFPEPTLGTQAAGIESLEQAIGSDPVRGVRTEVITVVIEDLAQPPAHIADAYLRLHLLSHRLVRPRSINLDGIFGLLTNVAWTDRGPIPIDQVTAASLRARTHGQTLTVLSVDKFPRMIDYVVPAGVRIADGDRVRLGAHLAAGTTVMHEGFCNFNAGTLGTSMVEGRISAGVIIGDGSDIGGGASIMGTLSGGGTETISVGRDCLIGANAGIGISLGNDCVVEAGCYVTAGSRVTLPDGSIVKAAFLSGRSNLLLRRNSVSGALEALDRRSSWGGLNTELHRN